MFPLEGIEEDDVAAADDPNIIAIHLPLKTKKEVLVMQIRCEAVGFLVGNMRKLG